MDIKELAKQEIKDLEGTFYGSVNTLMEFKREGFIMGYEAAIKHEQENKKYKLKKLKK